MKNSLLVASLLVGCIWLASSEDTPASVSFSYAELYRSTTSQIYHMELDQYKNDGSILYGAYQYLATTASSTSLLRVTQSAVRFKQINSTHVVLSLSSRNCLWILNRVDGRFKEFAGTCGSAGYNRGRVGTGKFSSPSGVEVDIRNPGYLLVADTGNNALRSVNIQTGEIDTVIASEFTSPKGLAWTANADLLVTNKHYISRVSWSNANVATNNFVTGSKSIRAYTNGFFNYTRFSDPYEVVGLGDNLFLVADRDNERLRLLNFNTQRVEPVCFKGEYSCTTSSELPSSPSAIVKAGNDVYVGMYNSIYKLKGIKLPGICPNRNITAKLNPGQSVAKVTLPGGDTGYFSEGVHKFKRESNSKQCPFYVVVTADDQLERCLAYPNITAHPVPGAVTAEVLLPGGDTGYFSEGVHTLTRTDNSKNCIYNVIVNKMSPVVRRLVFKTEYAVTCDSLNNLAGRSFFQSVLSQRKNQLQQVCSFDCTVSTTLAPYYTCVNNNLVIYWPTDTKYSVDVVAPPSLLSSQLESRLAQFETPSFLEITILSHNPPLIAARKDSKGRIADVVLDSSCSDKTLTYDAVKDTCV